jgi:NAD+ synthase (glutamine-hydrolysing)
MNVALAQINTTVGDLDGNMHKIIEYIDEARERDADLVIFPELTITGYPPKDLLLKLDFIQENLKRLEGIIPETDEISAIIGFVDSVEDRIYNASAIVRDRELIGVQHKMHLPNYDVFDEKRYFEPAKESLIFEIDGSSVGVNICEDMWIDDGPTDVQAKDADFIVNISASPFYAGKTRERMEIIARRAKENEIPIVYVNLVGGQDDLIFDGRSYVFDSCGRLIVEGKQFEEDLIVTNFEGEEIIPVYNHLIKTDASSTGPSCPKGNGLREIHDALILGIRDYIRKNGFKKVVIGLSGGIDSALTAALAKEALGEENVIGVFMPSRFSSRSSKDDARELAENLGIAYRIIHIQRIFDAYSEMLYDEFRGTEFDVTEENIQARIRGNILMALSNKFGYLVLSTGNKSELSVGYATLYGDMAGGLAAISDVPKTTVYKLSEYINEINDREIIPYSTIVKEPSAELKEDQRDTDSLPEYEILDPILHAYIEENKSRREIIGMGFDEDIVGDIIRMVDHNEYKRQQSAIGIKITPKAFGSGRRMPITNRY